MDKWERNRQRRDEDRRRENKLALILTFPIVVLMTILVVFAIGDEWKRQEKEAVKRAQARRKAVQNEYLNSQLAAAAYEKSSIILPDNPVIL